MRKALVLLAVGVLVAVLFWSRPQVALVLDRDYYPTALSLIRSADKSIYLAVFEAKYYPGKDSPSNRLLEEIARKSREVKVVVYLDDLFNISHSAYQFLKNRGVNVTYGSGRTVHAKVLVVDSKYVLLGSTNWGYYSLEKNHEANVLIKSEEIARDLEKFIEGIVGEAKQLRSRTETMST